MDQHFYNGFIKRAQDYGLSVVEADRLVKQAGLDNYFEIPKPPAWKFWKSKNPQIKHDLNNFNEKTIYGGEVVPADPHWDDPEQFGFRGKAYHPLIESISLDHSLYGNHEDEDQGTSYLTDKEVRDLAKKLNKVDHENIKEYSQFAGLSLTESKKRIESLAKMFKHYGDQGARLYADY